MTAKMTALVHAATGHVLGVFLENASSREMDVAQLIGEGLPVRDMETGDTLLVLSSDELGLEQVDLGTDTRNMTADPYGHLIKDGVVSRKDALDLSGASLLIDDQNGVEFQLIGPPQEEFKITVILRRVGSEETDTAEQTIEQDPFVDPVPVKFPVTDFSNGITSGEKYGLMVLVEGYGAAVVVEDAT